MAQGNIIIKIFADKEELPPIESALANINSQNIEFIKAIEKKIDNNFGDINIICIEDESSRFLSELDKKSFQEVLNLVVVLTKENSLLISRLVKLGYSAIFILPNEQYKFVSYLNDLLTSVNHYKEIQEEKNELDFKSILGNSDQAEMSANIAEKVAHNPHINLLITGDTGTGKSLLAETIHKKSVNANSPFMEVTCTAIPENLLESELFGYEQGAFTDAKDMKKGMFEMAEDGTIFLDEIGDLSLGLQAKLLRVIDKKVFRRLGGVREIPVKARIISATNRDLEKLTEEKSFRKDLLYRLNVVSLHLSPLKDRKEDILKLFEKFVDEFSKEFEKSIDEIEEDLIEFLWNYSWPGNIRELRHAVERAVLLNNNGVLKSQDFDYLATNSNGYLQNKEYLKVKKINMQIDIEETSLSDMEKIYVDKVLESFEGNKSKTAKILGISRPKLDRILKNK
jgi:transcriptional regulator with PAS, ATPase and Fis domain